MKKIFFSLVFLIPFLLFSQHEIDDDLDVYGNIKSRVMGKKVQASVGHFDQIQLLGVFLDTNSIPPVIEVNGGGLLIVDPNYKFSINGSDVWRNIYDPFAYGADNTGASDATGYFNSKCPGGDCGDVFYPAKGTYRIDGTVNFPSNSVLKMDPETMLDGYGTLHGNSTYIDAGRYQIFGVNLTITGIWLVINPFPEWFGLSAYGDYAPGFLAKIDSLRHTDEWINFYHNPYFQGNLAVKDSIGIGTNTPAEKLDVIGKTKTTTFQITDSPTNEYVLKSDSSGNASWEKLFGSDNIVNVEVHKTNILDTTDRSLFERCHVMLAVNDTIFVAERGVTLLNDPEIFRFNDPADLSDYTSTTMTGYGQIYDMCYDVINDKIYGTLDDQVSEHLQIFSLNPHTMAKTVVYDAAGIDGSAGISICTDNTYLYGVTAGNPSKFFKLRISDWTLNTSVTWTGRTKGHSIEYSAITGELYAATSNSTPDSVCFAVIDTSNLTYTDTILNFSTATDDIYFKAIDATGGYAYVPSEYKRIFARIDTRTMDITYHFIPKCYGMFSDGENLIATCTEGLIVAFEDFDLEKPTYYRVDIDTLMYAPAVFNEREHYQPNEYLKVGNYEFITDWQYGKLMRFSYNTDKLSDDNGYATFNNGVNNIVTGDLSGTIGYENIIESENSFAVGDANLIQADNSVAFGKNNIITSAAGGNAGVYGVNMTNSTISSHLWGVNDVTYFEISPLGVTSGRDFTTGAYDFTTTDVTASGTMDVAGVTTISNNLSVSGTMDVAGVTTISNNLSVEANDTIFFDNHGHTGIVQVTDDTLMTFVGGQNALRITDSNITPLVSLDVGDLMGVKNTNQKLIDMVVDTDASDGTVVGLTTKIDANDIFGAKALSDGAGGIDSAYIDFTASTNCDFPLNFIGTSNSGSITYMEDEDRFDFDNDVDVIADLTAGTITSDGALLVNGAFTSRGIDDNGDDIAITISASTEKVNFSADADIAGKLTTVQQFIWQIIPATADIDGAKSGAASISGGVDADWKISFDNIPTKWFGSNVVLDSILITIETTVAAAFVNNIYLQRSDYDNTGTTEVTYATDVGNGTTTTEHINILASDYTMADYVYWILFDPDHSAAANEIFVHAIRAYAHLE